MRIMALRSSLSVGYFDTSLQAFSEFVSLFSTQIWVPFPLFASDKKYSKQALVLSFFKILSHKNFW
jgi:hypothetical protein